MRIIVNPRIPITKKLLNWQKRLSKSCFQDIFFDFEEYCRISPTFSWGKTKIELRCNFFYSNHLQRSIKWNVFLNGFILQMQHGFQEDNSDLQVCWIELMVTIYWVKIMNSCTSNENRCSICIMKLKLTWLTLI